MMKLIYVPLVLFFSILFFSCAKDRVENFMGSGTIEATEVTVSAKTAGEVLALYVDQGDAVSEGQRIAVLDTEQVSVQKEQLLATLEEIKLKMLNAGRAADLAEINLKNTEKKFDRIKALYEGNSATQQQFDDMSTAFKAASTQYQNARTSLKTLKVQSKKVDAQIHLLQIRLRDAKILAPTSGTILEKFIEKGELAMPGKPVVRIANLARMWIKVYISETYLGKINLNDNVELKIDSYPDRTFAGRVSWISPQAEFTPKNVQTKDARADLVYAVKVLLENPQGILKIGMPADVYSQKAN